MASAHVEAEAQAEYAIRTLRRDEVPTAVEWARLEGWEPGEHDVQPFTATDGGAFLGGFLDGALVAVVSMVIYDATFAFVGFYIVKPGHRGKGFGLRLWQAAVRRAGERRVQCIGLDGVIAQQANYQRSQFDVAYRQVRYGGVVPGPEGRAPTRGGALASGAFGPAREGGEALRIAAVDPDDAEGVIRYDETVFPTSRRAFLDSWLRMPGSVARAAIAAAGPGQALQPVRGYCVCRRTMSGAFKLGPVFADERHVAEALIASAVRDLPPQATLYLDVPEVNEAAVDVARTLGLKPVFETARMYRGTPPERAQASAVARRVFGVTSFELG